MRRPRLSDNIILGLLEAVDYIQDDLAAGMRFSENEGLDKEREDRYDMTCEYVQKLNLWWHQRKKQNDKNGQ